MRRIPSGATPALRRFFSIGDAVDLDLAIDYHRCLRAGRSAPSRLTDILSPCKTFLAR
jgi:hypothetical protein